MMGVNVETLQHGDGCTYPKKEQTVSIHYTALLPDGKKFESSIERGKEFSFKVGKGDVIRGWDEGIQQMSVGEKARLICTPDYAYGKLGYPGVIPRDCTLIFDVELISIK